MFQKFVEKGASHCQNSYFGYKRNHHLILLPLSYYDNDIVLTIAAMYDIEFRRLASEVKRNVTGVLTRLSLNPRFHVFVYAKFSRKGKQSEQSGQAGRSQEWGSLKQTALMGAVYRRLRDKIS